MSDMIERVTYAIMNAFFNREHDGSDNRIFTASPSDNVDLARAAIEAMREPTEVMIETGQNPDNYPTSSAPLSCDVNEVWHHMIDAVLDENS